MPLIQRLNYILLPVILLVFTLAGMLASQVFTRQARNELGQHWQQQLQFTYQEINLEIRSLQAALSSVLNSAQLINYLNSTTPEYQAFTFEASLMQLLRRVKRGGAEISALQLIAPQGKILFSVGDGDPFSEPEYIAFPGRLIEQTLAQVQARSAIRQQELLYPSATTANTTTADDQAMQYGLIQAFSPALLSDDQLAYRDSDRYLAVISSELQALRRLRSHLQQDLGSHYQLQITGQTSGDRPRAVPAYTEHQHTPVNHHNGMMDFTLHHPLFELTLHIDHTVLSPHYMAQRRKVAAMMVLCIALSFLSLRWLIQRQIVGPINRLTTEVELARQDGPVSLSPIDRNDEVARLNNAYRQLLNNVQQLAAYDPLTGLANRRSFQHWLGRHLPRALEKNQRMALLFIDLDNFKRVNDHYGHATGDRLLRQFGNRLQQILRPEDISAAVGSGHPAAAHPGSSRMATDDNEDVVSESMARLAGDEFAVLLSDIPGPDTARQVALRIQALFEHGFETDQVRHEVHASIGIALCPEDGKDAQTLLNNADEAMYLAKAQGKNRYQFFTQAMAERMRVRQQIEKILLQELAVDGFELVYMPYCHAQTLKPAGTEVLLRCPALTALGIGPDQFIPVAESTGLIRQIDLWGLRQAMARQAELQRQTGCEISFSVNISATELHNEQLPDQVAALLAQYGIRPQLVELEITETSLVANDEQSTGVLHALKALGVSIALDDFGTGYTAFTQLAAYPVDTLKIDRSFVNDIHGTTANEQPMLDTIIELARLYRLRIIAEGVETLEQQTYLQQAGCDFLQGYYLCRPLSWDELQQQFGPHFDSRLSTQPSAESGSESESEPGVRPGSGFRQAELSATDTPP